MRKPKLVIIARRWFDKKWGNTYFSVKVFANHKLTGQVNFEYGYGEQYLQAAHTILKKLKYFKDMNYSEFEQYRRDNRELFIVDCCDVDSKKNLHS